MRARTRFLALTLDLDGPEQYRRLHDLADEGGDALAMYGAPLERFADLCARVGGPGTLFAIGRDVERGAGARLRPWLERGFEVASHSYAHDYAMSRWDAAEVREDLTRANVVFQRELGVTPVGFRAPGYHVSAAMLDALEGMRFRYGSSVLASPAYYAAKATVLGIYRLLGKRSVSLLGGPAIGLAPIEPYRPGPAPYRAGTRSLWELPLAVTRWTRLPITAASLVLAPALVRKAMVASLRDMDVVVLNMHAMDFAGEGEVEPQVRRFQPELRRRVEERLDLLAGACRELARDRRVASCAEITEEFEQSARVSPALEPPARVPPAR